MKKLMILIAIMSMALISNAQMNKYQLSCDELNAETQIFKRTPEYYQDMQEYQKECFNDSVQVVVWKSWEGMGFVESVWAKGERPFNCESYPTDSILYLHDEPTFMGFIEFLNKKYNKK